MKISQESGLPEISEKKTHTHSSVNFKPIIYRIVITEKTGRFENEESLH
jgi:hypothetical protein